ncbi:MAG: hypothetical protein UX80_C0010G0016 [Candidatus Amesbacteria bacterium GW2011_GWA2_47_11b]|uniref:HNH endonuclease 5 domain-containing protein n=1 Tax=Candidatus Amesbacteria bacterium GW2011_GWA2_47_11b TaxID=1618358 RepID=A0A0G1UJ65_9BACT|nr:MAG: hypothetical protein UX80_C0010G0016 [Candidatus Amesbacteria bacterium GW2011_GWA2_47_11b]
MSVCVYCGKEADTREHIPARNLFSITANVPFITVPSCKTCNSGFQMDEEFFRNFLVSILYEQSQSATILLDNSVARSMRRKPALGLKMFEQMSLVDYYDGFGNYHGKKTAMHIKPEDHARIYRVLDKYIRGLFYNHFKKPIPKDWSVEHHWLLPKFEEKVVHTLKGMRWERVREDTFVYGFNSVPETNQSVWCMIFYERPLFYTFVVDPVTASKRKMMKPS